MFLTLIPVFGVRFSALLLGESMDDRQFIGSVAVIASMAMLAKRELSDARRSRGQGSITF